MEENIGVISALRWMYKGKSRGHARIEDVQYRLCTILFGDKMDLMNSRGVYSPAQLY